MRCDGCGAPGTRFSRGRRPPGEVVRLCPACYERERATLAPPGDGCGCMPAPLPRGTSKSPGDEESA